MNDIDIDNDNEIENDDIEIDVVDRAPEGSAQIQKKLADERKRFLKEKIELRQMAKELGLSMEDLI